MLVSALARASNLAAYNPTSDIGELAAAYAFGIVRNHPFVDANKRTALAVLGTFLNYNGYELLASDEESCEHMVGVAEALTSSSLTHHLIKRRRASLCPNAARFLARTLCKNQEKCIA